MLANEQMNVVRDVCANAGINADGAVPLHNRANAVYMLPHANAVLRLRLTRRNSEWVHRIRISLQVTRWLAERGFPTVLPLMIEQPISIDDWTATFWRYEHLRRPNTATVADLAIILRELHAASSPSFDLPSTDPLGSLRIDLDNDEFLKTEHHEWLRLQVADIERSYPNMPMPLESGLIHGDAHVGNLLDLGDRRLLADWDSVSHGTRVQDLIPTLHRVRHFGYPHADWIELCNTYGVDPDIEYQAGVQLLQRARELRSLAAYVRRADQIDVRTELEKRLHALMSGCTTIWTRH
jgi:Ser/Thr protein kinase RdoA (MazF antagonist)